MATLPGADEPSLRRLIERLKVVANIKSLPPDEGSLRRLSEQRKRTAKNKWSLPTSVKEIKSMLLLDRKVSQTTVQVKDLIELYVKQLSVTDMKKLLKVNINLVYFSPNINANCHVEPIDMLRPPHHIDD